ncbi:MULTISPECIES: FkbM family methyltransferase [Sphingomonadales]|uniref:FkbM family methyltransferase n=2 Tax=Sphingomonadaceae TaxID=41297 RepID=A0A397PII1_9SPHN|nr:MULTISPECIES: FkbM family methyltransferase [Sphingomonadaceae]MDF0545477.1 FkbM family methyltransferase [Sphingobium arseniciresistens]RIA45954.1 FkbM family methyltransferase [Hephaestia caeni]WQE08200.1 FkbM family methyltransferase [Sphingobium yanoikuyae]
MKRKAGNAMPDLSLEKVSEAGLVSLSEDEDRMLRLTKMWRETVADDAGEINPATLATLADVWNCYRLLLNRVPDPIGTPHHLDALRDGISIHQLVERFVLGHEFLALYSPPAPPGPLLMAINGIELHLPAPRTIADATMRATGYYKPHLTGVVSSILQPAMYVLDVGAGAGQFAVRAARKVGPAGRVVALEPHPGSLRSLLANILTHTPNNVDALPFGAADGDGFLTLIDEDSASTSRDVVHSDLTSGDNSMVVYARTIDSLIPIDKRVDVIKIDLDGFDHRALHGASKTLSRCRPHLLAAYAPKLLTKHSNIAPSDYLLGLRQLGYSSFVAIPDSEPPIDCGQDITALACLPDKLKSEKVDFYAWTE